MRTARGTSEYDLDKRHVKQFACGETPPAPMSQAQCVSGPEEEPPARRRIGSGSFGCADRGAVALNPTDVLQHPGGHQAPASSSGTRSVATARAYSCVS